MFSGFTNLLQRLLDTLEKLPFKYLVSKGRNGDKVKLPSERFIGSNFLNQLAALQVCDAAICHGMSKETFTFWIKLIDFFSQSPRGQQFERGMLLLWSAGTDSANHLGSDE